MKTWHYIKDVRKRFFEEYGTDIKRHTIARLSDANGFKRRNQCGFRVYSDSDLTRLLHILRIYFLNGNPEGGIRIEKYLKGIKKLVADSWNYERGQRNVKGDTENAGNGELPKERLEKSGEVC